MSKSLSLMWCAKWLLVAAVLCGGVTGGVYLGYGWAAKRADRQAELESRRRATGNESGSFLSIADGDAFPDEEIVDGAGRATTFSAILGGHEAFVIFADWECSPCLELLRFSQTQIIPQVHAGLRVIVATKKESGPIPPVYQGLVNNMQVVFIDGSIWKSRYRLSNWPTIIGINESGFVNHVQTGFSGALDYELVDRFLNVQ